MNNYLMGGLNRFFFDRMSVLGRFSGIHLTE